MKKLGTLLAVLLVLTLGSVSGKALMAALNYASFYAPDKGPYIETYLSVQGESVVYKQVSPGAFQGALEIVITFSKDGKIVFGDKYKLLSPTVSDTSKIIYTFLDQQRISLPNGDYEMEISIFDLNNTVKAFENKEKVTINFPEGKVSVSEIELLESYAKSVQPGKLTKSGVDLVPYVSNFYPEDMKSIKFYAELYNCEKLGAEGFIVQYYIQNYDKKQSLGTFARTLRQKPQPVNVILGDLDISKLPSGNYNLVVEIKDKSNTTIAMQKLFFQRSNILEVADFDAAALENSDVNSSFVSQYSTKDSLVEIIACLRPISTQREVEFASNQIKLGDIPKMQRYFLDFWTRRNPSDPYQAWMDYLTNVKAVQAAYGTSITKGYETDRGRVYLKYGPPNFITPVPNDPNSYPYEVWQYYRLKAQVNRRFVFYAPNELANDYQLLHSDALGEIQDPQWQLRLRSRNTPNNNFDVKSVGDSKMDDVFRNPR